MSEQVSDNFVSQDAVQVEEMHLESARRGAGASARALLSLLDLLPDATPPPGLIARTLRRIEQANSTPAGSVTRAVSGH